MSFLQQFWRENLQQIFTEVKQFKDRGDKQIRLDCFNQNQKNEDQYLQCLDGYHQQFQTFILEIEYEQRKVYECVRNLSEQTKNPTELQNKCLPKVKENLYQYLQEYKANFSKYIIDQGKI